MVDGFRFNLAFLGRVFYANFWLPIKNLYFCKMKKLSVTEYAQLRKISRQAVLKRLHPEIKPLQGVKKVEKVGKTYILTLEK